MIRAVRVLLFGATGAIGRQLVAMLLVGGHSVIGTTRREARAAELTAVGASAVVVDAFDSEGVAQSVAAARPDVIIHQLTDLAAGFDPPSLRSNARLRIVGTRNIVEAMKAAGVARLIAQSAAWLYAPGGEPHAEDDPLRSLAERPDDAVLPGVVELERLVVETPGIDGVVLRYGFLYGPGTVSPTREDRPSVHVAAAARAAALAVARGQGIYNIVDDGDGVSNSRARRDLDWTPSVNPV
jgi:nucleoside-diphosphate-sugar epimerase